MKNILLTILIVCTTTSKGFTTELIYPTLKPNLLPEISVSEKTTRKPTNTLKREPRKRPMIYHHYYTTTIVEDCDRYINIINEKNKEIEALRREIKNLKEKKYELMQQQLKEEYEREMKKFEERRR